MLSQALAPVQSSVGSAVQSMLGGLLGFAKGGAFLGGRVTAFAQGGVVDRPTTFPMRGGTGLMGEAGPEAIMPLARGADGRLGVRGGGGSMVNVTMNITSPDAFEDEAFEVVESSGLQASLGARKRISGVRVLLGILATAAATRPIYS